MVYHAYISQFKNLKRHHQTCFRLFPYESEEEGASSLVTFRMTLLSVQICPTVSQRLCYCGNVFVRRSHFKFKTEPTQSSS